MLVVAHAKTNLSIKNGRFHASGTSLPVIMEPFRQERLAWFSLAYGDVYHGEHENLLLIGADARWAARNAAKPVRGDMAYLTRALRDHLPVREYSLADELRTDFGVGPEEAGYPLEPMAGSPVLAEIRIHDDCFASVNPAPHSLLIGLVGATLELHSDYMDREVDWSAITAPLTSLLVDHGELSLTTEPDAAELIARYADDFRVICCRSGSAELRTP